MLDRVATLPEALERHPEISAATGEGVGVRPKARDRDSANAVKPRAQRPSELLVLRRKVTVADVAAVLAEYQVSGAAGGEG